MRKFGCCYIPSKADSLKQLLVNGRCDRGVTVGKCTIWSYETKASARPRVRSLRMKRSSVVSSLFFSIKDIEGILVQAPSSFVLNKYTFSNNQL